MCVFSVTVKEDIASHTVSTLSGGSSLDAAVKKEGDEKLQSNPRLQLTVEMFMQLTTNIIKTAGQNMSQMCFVNTRPHQTSSTQVK